jgi:sterol desaturase/sphingolipid hydroxylase (fatty acid hydroxylase superfamily)
MIVPIVVIGMAIVMMVVELRRPGRQWPRVAGWWWRAALLNTAQLAMVFIFGVAWEKWMTEIRLFSGESLGVTGGAIIGYLVITFVYYWWHRWRHESGILWRWFHQIHHSAQRIEIITSFYKHPFELFANGVLSSFILYALVGLSPVAATNAVLICGLAELFYHWNVKTPHWLGYIVQRPESHCVHHQESLHWYNFSDIPLWDMMFGTFYNPQTWQYQCGLGADNERRLLEMLIGRDLRRRSVLKVSL